MITVDSKIKGHIINDLVENTVEILFPNNSDIATITMDNIVEESMTLKQSICSDNKLKFGGCIASEFTISVCDTENRIFGNEIKGKWIFVRLTQRYLGDYIYPSSTLYPSAKIYPGRQVQERTWDLFCGYVDKFQRDGDDKHIYKLTAYDYMAKLNQKDGTNALYKEWKSSSKDLGYIMKKFAKDLYTNITVNKSTGLLSGTYCEYGVVTKFYEFQTNNSNWLTGKNDKVSYGDVLRNCCEMLGAFAYVGVYSGRTYGIFQTVYLDKNDKPEVYDFYEDLSYENYETKGYTTLKWKEGNDLSGSNSKGKFTEYKLETVVPSSAQEQEYDLTNNIVVWQKAPSTETALHYLEDFFSYKDTKQTPNDVVNRFYNCSYTPFTATVDGRPWVQVGDNVQFNVYETDVNGAPLYENGKQKMTVVSSVILSRTLSGIQALTDTLEAKGEL